MVQHAADFPQHATGAGAPLSNLGIFAVVVAFDDVILDEANALVVVLDEANVLVVVGGFNGAS